MAIPSPRASPPPMKPFQTAPTARPTVPALPSIHVRAIITWLAIFPLVALGMTAISPLTIGWHPVLRSLVLTLIVVPLAVYAVVPRLLASTTGRARSASSTSRIVDAWLPMGLRHQRPRPNPPKASTGETA